MAAASILDADMATVASWLKAGWKWWTAELRELVPQSLRASATPLGDHLRYAGTNEITLYQAGEARLLSEEARAPKLLLVMVDPRLCLTRQLKLPALGHDDLLKLVKLDADRIMPLPSDAILLAVAADKQATDTVGVVSVQVAGLPRSKAETMMADLSNKNIVPSQIGLSTTRYSDRIDLDFTAAFAEAGLIPGSRSAAAGWWIMVAFLFAINVGLLVWRDMQVVARLTEVVEAQEPAVNAARTIAKRISSTQQSALSLVNRRKNRNAIAVLAASTSALPDKAWVQRFSWDGKTVRLTGYKREGVDVIGSVRKSNIFVNVRAANTEVIAELPTGQPFDITAETRGESE